MLFYSVFSNDIPIAHDLPIIHHSVLADVPYIFVVIITARNKNVVVVIAGQHAVDINSLGKNYATSDGLSGDIVCASG